MVFPLREIAYSDPSMGGVHLGCTRNKSSSQGGLRSVDRNNKTTLPRTRPRETFKSYARDPSPRMVKLQSAG